MTLKEFREKTKDSQENTVLVTESIFQPDVFYEILLNDIKENKTYKTEDNSLKIADLIILN